MLDTKARPPAPISEWRWNNHSDRCDRCGATALYATTREELELLWCGHHYTQHSDALFEGGWKTLNNDTV